MEHLQVLRTEAFVNLSDCSDKKWVSIDADVVKKNSTAQIELLRCH